MDRLFLAGDKAGSARPLQLTDAIAEGATGTIHRITGRPGVVAKLYKPGNDLALCQDKIAAMLAAPPDLPPIALNGALYSQIAWPADRVQTAKGEFRGFTMPEIDFGTSADLASILQKSARRRKGLPEFYGGRVLLAANLAALVSELHILGHYIVDMKPMNMRFYPSAWQMAILDTDGFSIKGPHRRFPSLQFSDEYIAPEAFRKKPEELGQEQDLFALAVIIFRLLNCGIHPFQGVDGQTAPTTLQERIFARLYPYGRTAHATTRPVPASIHTFLEDETRTLFDRAFTSTPRPSAIEWRSHLSALINDHVLTRCAHNPAEHAHFSRGCGLCAVEARSARNVQIPGAVLNNLPQAIPSQSGRPPAAQLAPPPLPASAFQPNWQAANSRPAGLPPQSPGQPSPASTYQPQTIVAPRPGRARDTVMLSIIGIVSVIAFALTENPMKEYLWGSQARPKAASSPSPTPSPPAASAPATSPAPSSPPATTGLRDLLPKVTRSELGTSFTSTGDVDGVFTSRPEASRTRLVARVWYKSLSSASLQLVLSFNGLEWTCDPEFAGSDGSITCDFDAEFGPGQYALIVRTAKYPIYQRSFQVGSATSPSPAQRK